MAGIYIHIPFCRSRCAYCGFYSTTALELRQRYVDALCREMECRAHDFPALKGGVDTVYLGGGTPSQLTPGQLQQLFAQLCQTVSLQPEGTEVTMECNPDDVTVDFVATLQQLPVNRISMGAQTFSDDRLQFLHRRHKASQVEQAVSLLRQAGISNISIDLMYGFPGETLDDWQYDIDMALGLHVEHISAYALMYEEDTPLHRLLQQGRIQEIDEELSLLMYETLIDRLSAAGFEHYEISNFALPGRRSRHNSSYWTDQPYLGLGAAAHSYDGACRQWNVSDIRQYIIGIENGEDVAEREVLDAQTRYNDTVMLALRTCEGLDLGRLTEAGRRYCLRMASRFVDDGLLQLSDDTLRLTRRGLFVSDMVMSELMQV